jgi:transposase
MIGNGHDFGCGRQFAAWLGLVPGQYSSGGTARLGRITKAGDPYLRSLLVMGARAVLAAAKNKTDTLSRWAMALQQRRGYWKAVAAILFLYREVLEQSLPVSLQQARTGGPDV